MLCSAASAAPSSVTPWAAAHQAPLPKGFPSKSTGVRCHFLLQYINSSVITWSESPGSFLLLLIMHYFSVCTQQLCVIDSQFFFFLMNLNFWWSTENFNVYTGNSILCEHFFIKFLLKIIGQTSKKKRHNRKQFSDETLVRKIYWYTLKSRTQIFFHYKTSLTELYLSVSKCLLNCFTLRNVFNQFKYNIK